MSKMVDIREKWERHPGERLQFTMQIATEESKTTLVSAAVNKYGIWLSTSQKHFNEGSFITH